ncbi:MAG: GNAT family N-acetyltransferase [Hyphomicrobiales bacterium]
MIRLLTAPELETNVARFSAILCDAVQSGAGVSFLWPLDEAGASAYWRSLAGAVEGGRLFLFAAEIDGTIAGTVQLHKVWPPNQPHRGEIAKLLVHRDYRRLKLGTGLMRAVEAKARELGLTLITFDAVAHGPVEAFYRGLGFTCVGYIPGYAYGGDGKLDDTAIFYKQL